MKKYLLLPIILLGFSMVSYGQNLVLSGYNLTVSDPGNTNTLESTARLDNNGSTPVDIVVERDVINLPAGMYELFCFGAFCNPPGTAITSYTTPIAAGGRESTFDAKVMPNGNCGTASIHYRFYDQNNPADSTGFTLDFAFCAQGLNDVAESFGLSKPLKNPADQFTVFTYNLASNSSTALPPPAWIVIGAEKPIKPGTPQRRVIPLFLTVVATLSTAARADETSTRGLRPHLARFEPWKLTGPAALDGAPLFKIDGFLLSFSTTRPK